MSNETVLDWLARNVHKWPTHTPKVIPAGDAVFELGATFYSESADVELAGGNTEIIERDDWLSRRAELQNKPSWEDAPEWAEWLAQDEDGEWKWLGSNPSKYIDGWTANKLSRCKKVGAYGAVIEKGTILCDWRDTLERRPADLSEPAVTERLTEATQTVLAAAPALMDEKFRFDRDDWFERGELPPVGSSVTVAEVDGLGLSDLGREFVGEECKVMAVFTRPELSHSDAVDVVVVMEHGGGCCCFVLEMIRPIRTERDVLIEVILSCGSMSEGVLADAILAAGFKRGAA